MEAQRKNYWNERCVDASDSDVINDVNIDKVNALEIPELLDIFPNVKDKVVLDLGAGNGRLTKEFLRLGVKHVTAVDFTKGFVEENIRRNGHHNNVTFICEDATKLNFEKESVDLVVCNWLFQYLDDNECLMMLEHIQDWLKPGGHFFTRDSCIALAARTNKRIVSVPGGIHSGKQRYIDLIEEHNSTKGDQHTLKTIKSGSIEAYIKFYQDPNQNYWLLQKVQAS